MIGSVVGVVVVVVGFTPHFEVAAIDQTPWVSSHAVLSGAAALFRMGPATMFVVVVVVVFVVAVVVVVLSAAAVRLLLFAFTTTVATVMRRKMPSWRWVRR